MVFYQLILTITSFFYKIKLYSVYTRDAKCALYFHYNHEPAEIIFPLTHKDVVLDFFKGKKEVIFRIHSGTVLQMAGHYFSVVHDGRLVQVLKYFQACTKRLTELRANGYPPYQAVTRFVLAWKGEGDDQESAVLLPDSYLRKMGLEILQGIC